MSKGYKVRACKGAEHASTNRRMLEALATLRDECNRIAVCPQCAAELLVGLAVHNLRDERFAREAAEILCANYIELVYADALDGWQDADPAGAIH